MKESSVLRFGRFEVQAEQRRLLQDGKAVALGARAFDTLLVLAERCDRVVTKAELLDEVWSGLVVEENNLQVQISSLRKLLGPQTIATIPGRGYRFTAALDGVAQVGLSLATSAPDMAEAPVGARVASRGNLPLELPPLYGRETDIQALRTLIVAHRLVTVVGAGGIGKSRLAQSVAHAMAERWTDAAWMVELAGLAEPALLPNAVAQVLDLKLTGQASAVDALVAGMASRHALLVLDNCEHLLDAVAALVPAILRAAPNVNLLCTSQEPLHIPDEQQYRVVPLAVPLAATSGARNFGAVALFEARVRAVDARFALTDESLALAIDICRRLDGLPLAIELAAARVATLGLRPVRDKLDARFRLLTGGSRASLRRHQTLRAALEWSHNLLDDDERAVFRRLGIFAGGFTIELAQAVAVGSQLDEWDVLDQLSALVDKSLVVVDAGEVPRYRLLESARAFALERLASAETADTLKRHAVALLDFLQRVDSANLDGELRTDQYATRVLPELDNLRAAYAWAAAEGGDKPIAIALAAHAGSLIDYATECADWLAQHLKDVDNATVDPSIAARYWRAIAAGNMAGRLPRAVQADAADRAQSLYRTLGQPRRVFSSLMRLAQCRSDLRQEAAAHAALDAARGLIRADWPAEFRILLLRGEGRLAREAGRFTESLARHRDEVRLSASTGDWRLEVMARTNLVDLLWEVGPIEEAAHEACGLAEELRARPAADADMYIAFANVMGLLSKMGRIDAASAAACEALPIMRRIERFFVEEWAYLFWRRGQLDIATRLLGASDAGAIRDGAPLQPNEFRLIAEARSGIEAVLQPEAFARGLAAGAALDQTEIPALIAEALLRQ